MPKSKTTLSEKNKVNCLKLDPDDFKITWLHWFVDFYCVIKSTLFIPITLIISFFIIFFTDQIRDFMLAFLNSNKPLPFLFFEIFLVFWAHATWLSTRIILNASSINFLNDKCNLRIQKGLARFYGIVPFLIIISNFIKLYFTHKSFSGTYRFKFIIIIILNLILGISFLLIIIYRRDILDKYFPDRIKISYFILDLKPVDPKITYKNYFKGSYIDIIQRLWALFLAIILFFILLVLFMINNIKFAQHMGTVAILLFFLAFITYLSAVVIHLIKVQKIPVILITVAWIILCSIMNNNYGIRVIDHSLDKNKLTYFDNNININNDSSDDKIQNNWENWFRNRPINNSNDNVINYPVFLIAVEGGGLRSSYWSSQLLSKIQSIFPDFHEHIYILSGVSGGSVGITVYSALLYDYITKNKSIDNNFHKEADKILKNDFLSPVTGSLLCQELVQRILPVPITNFDRAKALEKSLERSGANNNVDCFSKPFYQLWFYGDEYLNNMPNLIFNTTHFEKGNRVIITNLPETNKFIDTVDFLKKYDQYNNENITISLSTAAFLSARYPYITPSAQIYNDPEKFLLTRNLFGNPSGHLVDGGYFENSGSATLFDIMINLRYDMWKLRKKNKNLNIRPDIRFVVITNDENKSKNNCNFVDEMTQPLAMFVNTFSSRVKYSKELINKFRGNLIELNMDLESKIVPLGWFLSENARNTVKCYCDYLLDQSITKYNPENINNYKSYLSDYSYINEIKNTGKNPGESNLSDEQKRKNYIYAIKGIKKLDYNDNTNDKTNIDGLIEIMQLLDQKNNSISKTNK